ncbi:MAG TPA: hypothetical protein PLC65_19575, partial [Bacteroidia bacterium]|nr:hypothetical protein [Bacteroidia bacterium]
MKSRNLLLSLLLISVYLASAQKWSLKITSHIGFRKYIVDTKAVKDEVLLSGAAIKLYKGNSVIDQAMSDGDGYFSIFIPGNGEFILTVA